MKGLHKHEYRRIEDEQTVGIFWQRHECKSCFKTVGLDDWQIADLPLSMKYETIDMTPKARTPPKRKVYG